MRNATTRTLVLGLLSVTVPLALGACDDDASMEHDHDHEHDDHGHDDHGEELEHDEYKAGGITKMTDDGHFMVTLVSDPEPPSKGFNTWTLTIMNHEEQSMVDGAMVTIEPWMPEHGHGSDSEATVEAMGQGDYVCETVELQMLGTWDTTVKITHGEMSDEVHFVFDIE